MDRLTAMALFVRVAELGSFSAAAEQSGLARSLVTRQIAALESLLGVKLIARSTRRLTLTTAGAAYMEKCRVILNLVDAAETDLAAAQHVLRGPIRLSLPLGFGQRHLSPLLMEFAQSHPEVSLDMDFSDRASDLIEEGFDVALRIARELPPSTVTRQLGRVRLQAVAAPAYLARHGRPQHPDQLVHHQCLGYTAGGRVANWTFLVDGQLRQYPVRSRYQANNGTVLMDAAAGGLGITCHPEFIVAPYLADGSVEEILREFPIPEYEIHALFPGRRHLPYRVRALVDFLANRIAAATR